MTQQPASPAHHGELAPGALDSTIRAVGALSDIFDNGYTATEELALAAVKAGRPAYWSTASYHNQVASTFADRVNEIGLRAALALHADDSRFPTSRVYLLGGLIPLNRAARRELEEARLRAWACGRPIQTVAQFLQAAE